MERNKNGGFGGGEKKNGRSMKILYFSSSFLISEFTKTCANKEKVYTVYTSCTLYGKVRGFDGAALYGDVS